MILIHQVGGLSAGGRNYQNIMGVWSFGDVGHVLNSPHYQISASTSVAVSPLSQGVEKNSELH